MDHQVRRQIELADEFRFEHDLLGRLQREPRRSHAHADAIGQAGAEWQHYYLQVQWEWPAPARTLVY